MLVTTGSITAAQRLAAAIERGTGAPASVVHTPSEINSGGCSYSVRFNDRYEADVRRIAEEYDMQVRRFFRGSAAGGYYAVP